MTDEATSQVADTVRADVWLWRARFFKTRTEAADFIEEGRIRLTRVGHESRIDKPARNLKVGDSLVFALGGKLTSATPAWVTAPPTFSGSTWKRNSKFVLTD